MSKRTITLVVLACIATATLSATALASIPKVKTGRYAGTTSEQGGTVTLRVTDHGKRISGFTATDGYNAKCEFSGGVGGIPTYTVKAPTMKLTKSRAFSATVTATAGPFSGTFKVKGKFVSGKVRGTVTEAGSTCGSGASNPTTPDYLETFAATHA
jgi:hypothetical protein